MKSLLIRRAALLVLVLIGALEYAAPGAAGDTADEAPAAVAVDTGDAAAGDPAPSISDHPRWGIALAEILGSNLAVNLFDRFVYETYFPAVPDNGWADTTWTSWEANLKGPWHFDEDPWSGNEIGHPYQGAIYYAAARSNGLDFWESAAGTALGAFTWKIFGEVDDSNINDLVTTTMGGASVGEMFHRLYVETKREGSLIRFVFGPVDAANDAVFGEGSWDRGAESRVSLSLEAGLVAPFVGSAPARELEPGFAGLNGEFGESIVYGDPFGEDAAPFDYFEQRLDVQLSPSFWGVAFFSNGILGSFPLADTELGELALAPSLHYDFIYGSFVELEANSLGLSLIGDRRFKDGFRFWGEFHLNAVVLGTTENTYLRELYGPQQGNAEGRDYDWCFGEGAKVQLCLAQPRLGSISLDYVLYCMNLMPGTANPQAPLDLGIIGLLDLSFEHPISPRFSVGAAYTLYHKNAFYDLWPSVNEYAQAFTLYGKLHLGIL
ncbi:MAG: DUF3943 domain-containing protein [Rectinemataceae bacterium]